MIYRYFNPVRTYQGYGSLSRLPELVAGVSDPQRKVLLLVWNESVLEISGICDLKEQLGEQLIVKQFTESNPEIEQLYQMYRDTCEKDIGLIIAVGGGSVLDVGKSLCCLMEQKISDVDELRKIIAEKKWGLPCSQWIGVPTTAGTGSEVTCWATIWDSEKDVKYSIEEEKNYAFAAIVDPQLASSMPMGLAVSSALDAVAHAAESYWSKSSNPVSAGMALQAIRLIMGHIDDLLKNRESREAHEWMAKGSMLAGLAFSNTHTTACHSISYPLTMQHHIPHGVAVSLLLGPVWVLNSSAINEPQELLKAFGVKEPGQVSTRINSILEAAGYPAQLRKWGVLPGNITSIAAHSMTKGRADNNPVELTEDIVAGILNSVL